MLFKKGDWSIMGSSGGSATIGTPTLKVQVGVSKLNLPIENNKTKEQVTLNGWGGGASAGVSIELPFSDFVNFSMSTEDTPSSGLGSIYRKETSGKPYAAKDLCGPLMVVTGGAGAAAINGTISIALWQSYPVAQCVIDEWNNCDIFNAVTSTMMMVNPTTMPAALLKATHAIGFFTGLEATSDLASAGGNIFMYNMSA